MAVKEQLKNIIEQHDTKVGKYFDLFIQLLIILSLISFSVETIPNLSGKTILYLNYFELFTIIVFSVEYLLRLYVADKKLKYIFSFYGIIDLLAILPFYLRSVFDLRSIRILRLFRILRTFKLLRFVAALERLKQAFYIVRDEFIVFSSAIVLLIYISAVFIYFFENPVQPEKFTSIVHCFWWAITTLTTVGYGDMSPITLGGKIFTSIIILLSLAIVAIPAGLLASALSEIKNKDIN